MANTQALRTLVEPEIKKKFLEDKNCKDLGIKMLCNTQPDIVAIRGKTLIIGEITVSGYKGYRGKFHIGATRKLAESSIKLLILKHKKNEIANKLLNEYKIQITDIELHFVFPENSEFINALGWRENVFALGINKTPVRIDKETEVNILNVLNKAKNEVGKKL